MTVLLSDECDTTQPAYRCVNLDILESQHVVGILRENFADDNTDPMVNTLKVDTDIASSKKISFAQKSTGNNVLSAGGNLRTIVCMQILVGWRARFKKSRKP